MYQAMISEVAKNKLENFKPSFDEINKKMSPNELLNKSQEFGSKAIHCGFLSQ